MNKTLFALLVALLLSSCEKIKDTHVKMIVDNYTEKNMLILAVYPTVKPTDNQIIEIKAQETNRIFFDHLTGSGITSDVYYFQVWVYNTNDSTYCILGDDKSDDSWNYQLNQNYNVVETRDNHDNYIYNYSFVIDKSLLPKMLKNTHLTDSVFGLKNMMIRKKT